MRRQRVAASQAPQVDNAAHASATRGSSKVARANSVSLLKRVAAPHRMNEIIGLIDAGQSRVESFRGKNVAGNDLRARADPGPEVLRTTRETTYLVALCFQHRKQAPADVSGCTGYENEITSIHLRLQ